MIACLKRRAVRVPHLPAIVNCACSRVHPSSPRTAPIPLCPCPPVLYWSCRRLSRILAFPGLSASASTSSSSISASRSSARVSTPCSRHHALAAGSESLSFSPSRSSRSPPTSAAARVLSTTAASGAGVAAAMGGTGVVAGGVVPRCENIFFNSSSSSACAAAGTLTGGEGRAGGVPTGGGVGAAPSPVAPLCTSSASWRSLARTTSRSDALLTRSSGWLSL
mmetsp:Transcript_9208/g.24110  ORF Transcript_9208/g.24110 Transcript_9208/m.24110 type:complete len:222 (+) Transcript_9208:161-826(+)